MAAGPKEPRQVVVVAAVVERADQILVTQRLAGTHLAGYWEFPGGKTEDGEDHRRCLEREMREELDVEVEVGDELLATSFDQGVIMKARLWTISDLTKIL